LDFLNHSGGIDIGYMGEIKVQQNEVGFDGNGFFYRLSAGSRRGDFVVAFWGVVKSLVSPFISKVSISPSAIASRRDRTDRRWFQSFIAA
jgi:hypothetical protein